MCDDDDALNLDCNCIYTAGTTGTLASQAEIGVWIQIQPLGALAAVLGVLLPEKCELVYVKSQLSAYLLENGSQCRP